MRHSKIPHDLMSSKIISAFHFDTEKALLEVYENRNLNPIFFYQSFTENKQEVINTQQLQFNCLPDVLFAISDERWRRM